MKRRGSGSFLVAVVFTAIASVSWFAGRARGGESASPPNVVLMIADDMAYGDYGFMGHPRIRTPRLDRLSRESLSFRRGYATSSLCSPSLASILTGLYPHQHGITSNDPPLPPGVAARDAERSPAFLAARQAMIGHFDLAPTVARILGTRGYLSFEAGKWWGGSYERGGFTHGMTSGDPAKGGRHGDQGLAIGRRGMKPVFDFIDMARERKAPFMVWYAPMMPHSPHNPPERLLALYRDQAPSLEIAKYWAMCTWFDETCGQLLDFLDERKLTNDTLVVFLADNGWIQDPTADRYAPRSKQSPYEGGLRTPILLRRPGTIAARSSDVPVSEIDLAPTILTHLGLAPDPRMTGVDLLDDHAVGGRKMVFGEIFTHNAVDINDPASSLRFRWVAAGDWKLILPHRPLETGPIELYDLKTDPGETTNLAELQASRAHALEVAIDHWWPPNRP